MSMRRVAAFSVHTSPLARPGRGDSGGMNVYLRSLVGALSRAGVACDVFTRRPGPQEPTVVDLGGGARVIHIDAGPEGPLPKELQFAVLDQFTDAVRVFMEHEPEGYSALHAHYWLSGVVAHRLKHELNLPLVATFHTLGLVKAASGVGDEPAPRIAAELDVIRCADVIIASTPNEEHELLTRYGADPAHVEIIAPGVDHAMFSPLGRSDAKALLGLGSAPMVLFAGRIQPLKGGELAVRAFAALGARDATLVIVGEPSGSHGEAEAARLRALVDECDLNDRVRFVGSVAHEDLGDFYRAADVCVVPSHTESFGLVALEAAACGTPVVAASVGGLQSIVDDGRTGFLVASREPLAFAAAIDKILADPQYATEMSAAAVERSRRYSWNLTAARLRRLYSDLSVREPVKCR